MLTVWPIKIDMFANNVAQFGNHVGQQFQIKNVHCMFVEARNIFTNVSCSIECCLIWPLCSPTIQLIQVKVAKRNMRESLKSIVTSTRLVTKMEKGLRNTNVKKVTRVIIIIFLLFFQIF